MKYVFYLILFTALLVSAIGCITGLLDADKDRETEEEFIGKLENAIGTIENHGVFVIVVEADSIARRPTTFYQPSNLPEEFYQEGLRVIFSGLLEMMDPTVRYYGNPITLTEIRKLERK